MGYRYIAINMKMGYILTKYIGERMAKLQLDRLSTKSTKFRNDQAKYIRATVEGPYKSDYCIRLY